MRLFAVVLSLAFGGLQTLSFSDCRCSSPCTQSAKPVEGCGHCGAASESDPKSDDCCGKPGKSACTHIEPSRDVVSHAADGVVIAAATDVAPLDLVITPEPPERFLDDAEWSARPSPDRPLFLLHSSFLI